MGENIVTYLAKQNKETKYRKGLLVDAQRLWRILEGTVIADT